jgi:hypothetical protein
MGTWLVAAAGTLVVTILGGVIVGWLVKQLDRWRWLAGVAGVAASALILLALVVVAWPILHRDDSNSPIVPPVPAQGGGSAGGTLNPIDPPAGSQAAPPPPAAGAESVAPPRARQRYSQAFLLHGGEQQVVLDGQASVGSDFTRIGDQDVATLHVSAPGRAVADHAILSAGDRFEIEAAGRSYYLYVTGVDFAAGTMSVRIEERP